MSDTLYNARLSATRAADAKHRELMERIAAAGGKTYADIQAMTMNEKDDFLSKYARVVNDK